MTPEEIVKRDEDDFGMRDMTSEEIADGSAEVLREIDELARHADQGGDLRIAFDAETSWPFSWYLRNHPDKHLIGDEPTPELLEIPVIISGPGSTSG